MSIWIEGLFFVLLVGLFNLFYISGSNAKENNKPRRVVVYKVCSILVAVLGIAFLALRDKLRSYFPVNENPSLGSSGKNIFLYVVGVLIILLGFLTSYAFKTPKKTLPISFLAGISAILAGVFSSNEKLSMIFIAVTIFFSSVIVILLLMSRQSSKDDSKKN